MMDKRRKQQLIDVFADLLSAEIIWLCFLIFRWLVYEGRIFSTTEVLIPAFRFAEPLILYPIGCLIIYYMSGFYLRPNRRTPLYILSVSLSCAAIISLGSLFVTIINDVVPPSNYQYYLISLTVLFGLQFILCVIPRLIIYSFRQHNKQEERIFTLHGLEQVDQFLTEHQTSPFHSVIIDIPKRNSSSLLFQLIQAVYPTGVEILIVPSLYDMLTGSARLLTIQGSPYVCITEHKMSAAQLCIKRTLDIVISALSIIVLTPVYAIIAILVKTSSPGPVFYFQERIGLHGKPFQIIKFRTMFNNAEAEIPQLASDNDPRTTPIGRKLRKYRLDELPQFWNVLRGDMSLVGPRPERAYFIDKIQQQAPYYCLLYKIRPGLTSWGPIKVGYTNTIQKMIDRLHYDIVYMENMSLKLDIKIILYTLGVIVDGEGK